VYVTKFTVIHQPLMLSQLIRVALGGIGAQDALTKKGIKTA
jgi:hypothetical protein